MTEETGKPRRMGFGKRMAILVIDMTRGNTEERWARSSNLGRILGPISQLLAAARPKGVPVFYTRGGQVSLTARAGPYTVAERGNYLWKLSLHDDRGTTPEEVLGTIEIPPEIAPAKDDTVITKYKSSGFFGSALQSFLTLHRVDTVVVCGSATNSGVLHTVNDAFAYNYRVIVPRECTGTRSPGMHEISLEMMDGIKADVMPLSEVLVHVNTMPPQEPVEIIPPAAVSEAPERGAREASLRMGLGERIAVLIIDMHQHQATPGFPLSYELARTAVENMARVLEGARARGLPVFYTTGGLRSLIARNYPATPTERGSWLFKNELTDELGTAEELEAGFRIPDRIAPQPGDTVVKKYKPSGFFESPLKGFLNFHRIDTVIVCGSSTNSGVLFTVNDAFSYNYRVVVPRECCASRDPHLHEAALRMVASHADVVGIDELLSELQRCPVQEPVV